MFKVSLLPASYRKYLEGRKKKDLILKVALLILACMLVIYFGFYARTLILKGQLQDVNRQNSVITAEINELQQYKTIYDELVLSQSRLDAIKSKDPSSLKFLTMVQESRPEYIKITALALSDWQKDSICVIEGELSAAQGIGDAVDHLRAYEDLLKNGEGFADVVKEVKVVNDMPIVEEKDDGTSYKFRIFVSLGGVISTDEKGNLITTTTTTTTTTTAPATTASAESTSASAESTSAAE